MNATPTTLPLAIFDRTEPDYRLLLHKLPPEREILKGILQIQQAAALYLAECAQRDLDGDYSVLAEFPLTQFDYNGDHVDYNPAAARCLSIITDELCGDGWTRDLLDEDIITALGIPDEDFTDGPNINYAHKTPINLLCALLSNKDFLEEYETWGGLADNPLFDIAHKDDLN